MQAKEGYGGGAAGHQCNSHLYDFERWYQCYVILEFQKKTNAV